MANRRTKQVRRNRDNYKVSTGRCVNSSAERKTNGKKPYKAPTLR